MKVDVDSPPSPTEITDPILHALYVVIPSTEESLVRAFTPLAASRLVLRVIERCCLEWQYALSPLHAIFTVNIVSGGE